MAKLAVVLFSMGGPDSPEAVRPFLFNLFNDPAIIGAPGPVRWLLAKWISKKRAPVAREIYAHLGGKSPLLEHTRKQGEALAEALTGKDEVRAFVAMRYWHPFARETAKEVKAFGPDEVILLPMYPQYSTATSATSLADWKREAAAAGLTAPTREICCYPTDGGFIGAETDLTAKALDEASAHGSPRVLFSAHGLPKSVVAKGDPYQWQVEQSAAAIAKALGRDTLDWRVCYQSRVGPLEWIGPSTDDELERAGKEGVPVVLVPLAFVSEHSETLVELDIEYRELAEKAGVPCYVRVSTVLDHPEFIRGLADLVHKARAREETCCSEAGDRLCPGQWGRCAQA